MIIHAYSVYDKAAGAFMQPFFSNSNGIAMRSFMDACANKDMPFNKHPGDFELYHLCSFDDATGYFGEGDKSPGPTRLMSANEACQAVGLHVDA